MAVVDVGGVGADNESLQGHGEAPQATLVAPRRDAGVGSGGPQAPLHLVGAGHRLQRLQQQKGAVLALSCSMQEIETSAESGKMRANERFRPENNGNSCLE